MQQRWVPEPWSVDLVGRGWPFWLAVCALLGLTAQPVIAEEPSAKFLEKLKQAGYYDMAAAYIEQLQTEPSLSPQAKLALSYEQGDVLWKQSLNTRDPKARDEAIAKAQAKLAQFLKDAPKHANASDALLSLARMSYLRGQTLRKLAEKSPPDKREPQMAAARTQLAEAKKHLEASEKEAIEFLTPLNAKLKKQEELTKEEEDLKDKFFPALLEVRLLLGEALYENALTYDPKSKEYKDGLAASNKEFGEAYEKYAREGLKKRFGAGFRARTYQARNAILLGNYSDAKNYAWEVFATENIPAGIFKPAQRIAFEAMLLEGKFEASWKDVEAAMKDLPRISTPLDAEIFYYAALLAEKTSAAAKAPAEKNRIKALAIKYTTALLRFKIAFEFYPETRDLAKRLEIKNASSGGQSFAELNLEAKQVYGQYAESYEKWQNFQGPDTERKELLEQRDAMYEASFDAASSALAGAPRSTPSDDLAFLRFIICSYHSQQKNYYEAINFGEATALGGPTNRLALKGAGIALRSLHLARKELLDLKKKGTPVPEIELKDLTDHLGRSASYLLANWSTSPEADGARMLLASTEVEDGRLENAAKIIAAMDPKGTTQAAALLMLGTTAAQKYYTGTFGQDKTEDSAKAVLPFKPYITSALKPAVLAMQADEKSGLDERGVMGAYFYLLIKLREDISDLDALKIIEHPKEGILAKLKAGSEDIPDQITFSLAQIIFQMYLLNGKAESAIAMVDQLEKLAAKKMDEELKKKVNGIIIGAGRELEKQIKDIRDKDPAKATKLAGMFAGLLDKLAEKAASLEFTNLYAISESYLNLAETDPARKNELLKKAEGIYSTIIERAAKEPEFVKTASTRQIIRVKQIGVIRARGDFKDAYAKLKVLLKPKQAILPAQREAAQVLVQWANSEPAGSKLRGELLSKASNGDYDETNKDLQVIWGWNKLRKVTHSLPTFKTDTNVQNLFYEATLNMAQIRHQQGIELKEGEANKPKYFQAAKTIISDAFDQESFNQSALKPDIEKVLKSIQGAQKVPAIGLQEFIEQKKKQEAATAVTAAGN